MTFIMKNLRLNNRWSAKASWLVLVVVVCFGFSWAIAAEEISGDEVMLRKLFEFHSKLANQGNLESVVKLGAMYERGEGVAQDRKRAIELYRYAADRGSKAAMELLANIESNQPNRAGKSAINIKVPTPKSASTRNNESIKRQKELESKLQREKAAAEAARRELENMRRAQQEEQEKQEKLQAELARIQEVQDQLARERAKAEAARREMELLRKKQEEELQKQKEIAQKLQEQAAKEQQEKELKAQQEAEEQKKFSSNPCNTPAAKFMSTCN
jgi:DNA polymerase III gamma/tau subunit